MKHHDTLKVLCRVARKTRNNDDIQHALRFGVEHNISPAKIRAYLNGEVV